MTGDPEEVIDRAEQRKETIREHYLPAAEWCLEKEGLAPRTEVVADLAAHLDVDREVANLVVGHLVADDADPVQQVLDPIDGKYVGVIDHAEHDSFYAFDRYDDVDGRKRRAVCAHCVHVEREAADVTHFTRPPDEYDVERVRTALSLHYHVDHEGRALADVLAGDLGVEPAAFAQRHDLAGPETISLRDVTRRLDADPKLAAAGTGPSVPAVDVEPGASLVSETTIGGNETWHAGNDGGGTGLDADMLDGYEATYFTGGTKTVMSRVSTSASIFVTFPNPPITATSAKFKGYKTGNTTNLSLYYWGDYEQTWTGYTTTTTKTFTGSDTIKNLWYNLESNSVTVGGTLYFYY